jgi:hypothetical protein
MILSLFNELIRNILSAGIAGKRRDERRRRNKLSGIG